MNSQHFSNTLNQLFRAVTIMFLATAEAVIWVLYTQVQEHDWSVKLAVLFAGAGLVILGVLLARIVFGLLHKATRVTALSIFAQIVFFLTVWTLCTAAISYQIIKANNFRATDEYVLSVESGLIKAQPLADSTQYVVGSDTAVVPSATPRPAAKPIAHDPFANDPYLKDVPWGTTVEIAPHTYRTKIAEDAHMSTVSELFEALNAYRQVKGRSQLRMDDFLVKLAEVRLAQIPTETEAHKGFVDIMNQTNPSAYDEYGNFERFGENFSRGYSLTGTHLIEWVYAGDAGHDGNQLGDWNAVGIAIKGTTTVLEFGWK